MKHILGCLVLVLALALPVAARADNQQIIHPGDQLNIQVYGQQALTQTVTVMSDGSIDYPLIGRLKIGGETVDNATSELSGKLSKYVKHPYVSIAITQLAQPSVLVLGDVKNPGKYQLRSDARVTDAVAAAGGLAEVNGDLPEARISDPQGNVTRVPLEQLLRQGNVSLDKPVGEGYVVYIPGPTLISVTVTGAVDHPGVVQIPEGDHVSMAIAQAGDSAAANADLNHVKVIRTTPDGKTDTYSIDLYQALEKGDGSADIALEKNDEVYVPQTKPKTGSLLTNTGILYILGRLLIP